MKKLWLLFFTLSFVHGLLAQETPTEKLKAYSEKYDAEKVYLQLDKPIYKPNDDIWFKAYLRDAETHKASQKSEILYVELINPKGKVEKKLKLIAQKGTAQGDFHIAEEAVGGIYKIKAYTEWMRNFGEEAFFTKEIQVQKVVLPRLLMKLEFERKAYGMGNKAIAKLDLATIENRPLQNYSFNFVAQIDGQTFLTSKGQTNAKGKALIPIQLPEKITSNDGLLNVMINYEGNTESISRSIPITLNNIDLQFFAESGNLIENVQTKVAFKALNEFGKPADISGVVLDKAGNEVANFKSFHQGMGAFDFKPLANETYSVQITQPEGIAKTYTLPEVVENGYTFSIVEQSKDKLKVKVFSPIAQPLNLLAQVRGEVYFSKKLKAKKGKQTIEIPLQKFPVGIAQLTLFDYKDRPQAERLVFVNKHRKLDIKIKTNKEKYLPREKVELEITAKDEDGLPVGANFSLAVVNDKVISFADDKQDNILSYMLMSSDLKGKIEEPNFYFKEEEAKATQALDYLLMTQGWRRFTWKQVLENQKIDLKYVAEMAVVRGVVVRIDNSPIANATVTVLETEESTQTKTDGTFEFKNLDISSPLTLKVESKTGQIKTIQVNDYTQEYVIGGKIHGKVLDSETEELIPFATVYFAGTKIGTTTDFEGNFEIQQSLESNELVANYVGYSPQKIKVNGRNEINFSLEEDEATISEVVVGAVPKRRTINLNRRKKSAKMPKKSRDISEEINQELKVKQVEITEVKNKTEVEEIENIIDSEITEETPPPSSVLQQPEIIEVPDDAEIEELEAIFDENIMADTLVRIPTLREEEQTFMIVEQNPEFPGGMKNFRKFLENNLFYPETARKMGIEGRVYLQFVVDKDGSLNNIRVVRGINAELDKVARLVLERSPKWTPGKQRGRNVKVKMAVPVTFRLDDTKIPQEPRGMFVEMQEREALPTLAKESKYYQAREFYVPQYTSEEVPKTRTDFRETIYWNPEIELNKKGKATVSFYNSDEVTQFRITLEGIAETGLVGRTEQTYFTQLPFAMDTKIPAYLAFEDQIEIPVFLKNNTHRKLEGKLTVSAPQNLKSLKKLEETISIEANSVSTIFLPYEVLNESGQGTFSVEFLSEGMQDAFSQTVEVKAKGFPMQASVSEQALDKTFEIKIQDLVPNSLKAKLVAYPDPLSDLMSGIESILREPHGCFEQTSSSTYPNILAMLYMEETGVLNPEIREKAYRLIDKGYQRLITFETKENGFEWFGNTPPHEGLTAYGLMEFTQMSKVYNVDKKMLKRTKEWLLSRRDGKGGFHLSNSHSHGWNQKIISAYATYALSEAGYTNIDKEIEASFKEVQESKDGYRMALVINTLYNVGKSKEADKLLQELITQGEIKGWDKLKSETSVTSSRGKSLQIETASLALLAMLKAENKDLKNIQKVVNLLVKSRSYGGFGSTQATVLALQALTEYANFAKQTEEAGMIAVLVQGKEVARVKYEKGTKGEILLPNLEKYLAEGSNKVQVKFLEAKNALPYSLDVEWTTYTPHDSKNCEVQFETNIANTKIKTGETVRLTSKIKNSNKEDLPMTIALVGIPSGLSVQPWQLKELQEKKDFDYYEIKDNYVIFYFTTLAKNSEKNIALDLKAEVAGNYEAPASRAYLYYTNEFKDWAGGERIVIERP